MHAQSAQSDGPVVWIISTGTEILQGHSTDRNSPWLSHCLMAAGFTVVRHMALADDPETLREGLGEGARRADLILTTGGLGPTIDDHNRRVIAELWGAELREDAEALERIRERFHKRGRSMPEGNRVQALIPAGAVTLSNPVGTAPGFYLSPSGTSGLRATVCALPGPPQEMQPMFTEQVLPLIGRQFGASRRQLRTLTLRTIGVPESHINEQVKDLFETDPRVKLAMLASLGRVDIRLTLTGADENENARLEDAWRKKILERVDPHLVYAEGDRNLEEAVGDLLRERGMTLALAESCTGGLVGARLTEIPGSSDYFREGFVTYSNEAKMARLGVPVQDLVEHGAVSRPVVEAMARGALQTAQTDWALAITGIAGPGGGAPDKPVGLVWFALAGPNGSLRSLCRQFLRSRSEVRLLAATTAMDLLRRGVCGLPLEPEVGLHSAPSD